MYNNQKEIEIINIQFYTLILALITTVISIIITYNQKRELEEKDSLFTGEEILKLTLFNRIFILILSFVFLYVNSSLYKISKDEGEDLKPYELQIIASILTVIGSLIALYVVSLSRTETIADVENPII